MGNDDVFPSTSPSSQIHRSRRWPVGCMDKGRSVRLHMRVSSGLHAGEVSPKSITEARCSGVVRLGLGFSQRISTEDSTDPGQGLSAVRQSATDKEAFRQGNDMEIIGRHETHWEQVIQSR